MYPIQPQSPSTDLAMDMGTDPTKVQVMRASFFGAIEDEVDDYDSKSGMRIWNFSLSTNSDSKSFAVTYENQRDRDSPDQIVPNKRLFTFSSTHSMLSKEISSTTSSSSIDTPIMSPQLPMIREHETKSGELFSEVNFLRFRFIYARIHGQN